MSTEEKPQRLSPFLRRFLILKLWLIEKFRFGERQVTLVWAAVIGILGALVTEGFRRATAFRTRIEEYFETWAWRHRKEKPVLERSRCPKETAEGLLETSTAGRLLSRIQTVINCSIGIDEGSDGLRILNAGYHAVNSGVLVVGGGAADGIPLRDAVAALTDLLNEFDFQTPADRSRALAALISPALVFGGLIGGRVPADVAAADQSQSGKTYRQKAHRRHL